MAKVSMSTPLPATPSQVWDLIGSFNALPDWHPAVESSSLEKNGSVRRLKLVGGGEIVEELKASDKSGKSYTYTILGGPLPVANYTSTLRVVEHEGGETKVEWESNFEPVGAENDAVKAIQGVYQAGFDNLKKMFGQG